MTVPSWISTLSTSSIAADMTAADVNGVIGYAGLEKVFADLAAQLTSSGTTLTSAQLTDLQSIAANLNNGLSTSSYLTYVTKALVNGDAANAKWTGGAASATTLGNLAIGASGAQLSKLVGKWFLGSDLPTSSVTMDGSSFSISYSTSIKPLFASGGPSINDVNQGYLGDCYILSGLAEVVYQNSSLISSMFTVNGNGTYGVRFYVNGQAEYVTVDASLANGGSIFNHGGSDIWASLAEKAYAQLQASGVETGNSSVNYGNSFSTIGNGGAPDRALEEITGASVITDFVARGGTWTRVVYNSSFQTAGYSTGFSTATVCTILCADLAQGNDLILSSYTNATDSGGRTTLVASHAMSIYGFDSMTGMFEIRNPWGTASGQYWDTTFEVSLDTLLADGDAITADNVVHVGTPSLSVNASVSANRGQVLSLSSLLTISDPNNVGYQKLELKDANGTAAYGRFMVNGVAQAGGLEIDVTAANLGTVVYDAGTSTGTDTLWAQLMLNDGTLSGWQQFSVTAVDRAPVVTAAAANLTVSRGQTIAATSLFNVSDADNDTITAYQFWDSTADPSSGHWVVGGLAQSASQAIDVTPSQLSTATFQSGSGSDHLWVRAYDGTMWGAWQDFYVSAPVDHAPVVAAANVAAAHGQSFAATSLFNASDADNDTITAYQLWDSTADPSSGHWVVGGVAQSAGQAIDVTPSQLSSATFQSGSGSDHLWARAYDGTMWGAWQDFYVNAPVDHAPVITPVVAAANGTVSHGANIAATSLFNVSDADNDTITAYQLWDSTADPSSGHWVVGGVAQSAGQAIDVTAAQLSSATFQSGSGSDHLWARAYDGTMWGDWQDFNVTAPIDLGPVMTVADRTASPGQVFAASSLFSYSDPFGSPATQYDFWDNGAGGGHFALNGAVLGNSQDNIVSASQLSQMTYQAGSGTDRLWVRATDGTSWGSWSQAFQVTG